MFALLYKPPCGKWYVHSHKLYASTCDARDAARKFISSGTEYAIIPIDVSGLDEQSELH